MARLRSGGRYPAGKERGARLVSTHTLPTSGAIIVSGSPGFVYAVVDRLHELGPTHIAIEWTCSATRRGSVRGCLRQGQLWQLATHVERLGKQFGCARTFAHRQTQPSQFAVDLGAAPLLEACFEVFARTAPVVAFKRDPAKREQQGCVVGARLEPALGGCASSSAPSPPQTTVESHEFVVPVLLERICSASLRLPRRPGFLDART
jgi:hypothetical protein